MKHNLLTRQPGVIMALEFNSNLTATLRVRSLEHSYSCKVYYHPDNSGHFFTKDRHGNGVPGWVYGAYFAGEIEAAFHYEKANKNLSTRLTY